MWYSLLTLAFVVAGLFVILWFIIRAGNKEEVLRNEELKDRENANKIRDNVSRNLDERLRQYDDAGYRDK